MSDTELVILVDPEDQQIGTAEKLFAHQNNLLHRAFSIFIFCEDKILLQQRALSKYHSPGLWTNTCCSHPRPGEDILTAANRRLGEELGIEAELHNIGKFYYNAYFKNGLAEHEVDHVLVGEISAETVISPNPDEVHEIRWITVAKLQQEIISEPDAFTPWLDGALELCVREMVKQ